MQTPPCRHKNVSVLAHQHSLSVLPVCCTQQVMSGMGRIQERISVLEDENSLSVLSQCVTTSALVKRGRV